MSGPERVIGVQKNYKNPEKEKGGKLRWGGKRTSVLGSQEINACGVAGNNERWNCEVTKADRNPGHSTNNQYPCLNQADMLGGGAKKKDCLRGLKKGGNE